MSSNSTTERTTHTPGPWTVGEGLRGYDFGIVKPIEHAVIGIADIPEGIHVGEAEANARLIAAAPDLLAALKHIANMERRDPDGLQETWRDLCGRCIDLARIAVAKAEGVQ